MKKTKAPRVYRDSTTGRFVTKKYAKKHPKTTMKERRNVAAAQAVGSSTAAR